ncbi:MAG: bifunctional glutamate N-acetyltransferase/amino-acid acetyltransferase ArgJ [Hyphomonadaceae bacterium]|nr:bifunctional glutamate N-acetyltransferase/amino-acid acetyltransferase ArgJ [Hyphomonadaceae bacterium]
MDLNVSPLAPKAFPAIPDIDGLEMWVGEAGIKYKNRPDVWLVKLRGGSRIAGVFTKSKTPGAPVIWSKNVLSSHKNGIPYNDGCGILVNSGNANVHTGVGGHRTVEKSASLVADLADLSADSVYIASTGVIGEPLDITPIKDTISAADFFHKTATWEQAAQAISTTDTYLKGAMAITEIDGKTVNISGIAKGSGMIAPDMATMLGFIFTDANISQSVLQELLEELCETSFNAITVDSDTSTSDTVLLAATAQADHSEITNINSPNLATFKQALSSVMMNLAHQVVKDGEGAQKFIKVDVSGAENNKSAKVIAMGIANSPLVKTAIAGEDANWGRVVMAIGKTGEPIDLDRLEIAFGPHIVAKSGARSVVYDESQVSDYIRENEIEICVNVGLGQGKFTVWTCDLTHGYIDINADYRT